jgi:hypothetical protein
VKIQNAEQYGTAMTGYKLGHNKFLYVKRLDYPVLANNKSPNASAETAVVSRLADAGALSRPLC